MAKPGKFDNIMSSSIPSRSSNNRTILLQNIIEGDKPEYQYIKIDNIEFNPNNDYNYADTDDSIRELADDIRRNGLLHNIVVSYRDEGTYRLLSGERRLRAYKLLYEETNDAKYSTIYSLIRKGLSEVEETIILDAANLQARNSAADEKRYRKATARFINNLKQKFNISEEEAIRLAKQHASVQPAVIDKNIVLETDLHPSLLALLDNDYISKNQAYEYARLPKEIQEVIAEGLTSAKEKSLSDLKKTNLELLEPAKNIRMLDNSLDEQKKTLLSIQEAKKNAKTELENATPTEAEELKQKILQLEQQEKQYKESIKSTQRSLDENIESLNDQANEYKVSDEEQIPYSVVGAAATAEISALLDNVKESVNILTAAAPEEKIRHISEADKKMLNKKISKISKEIKLISRMLK